MLPLRVATEMGEEGVLAVSSAFAVTFHNVPSTASASSSANARRISDSITFPTSAQARRTVGLAQATKARWVHHLAIIAVGVENSALVTAKMRDYRTYERRRGVGEIGNPSPGDRCRRMLFEHDFRSPLGPDGLGGAPQEGLRGSEVEGRKSRPLVFGLPTTATLVTAAQNQNFLKHSLPVPCNAAQSAAIHGALRSGAI